MNEASGTHDSAPPIPGAARAPAATGWRRILVAVRGGADVEARVRLSLGVAAGVGADVTALYVIDERMVGDPDAGLVRQQLDAQLAGEGEDVLRTVLQLAASEPVRVTTRLERGPVVETILRVAEEIRADVIVVGSHRQTWLGRLLGRSLAESVLQGARCTVMAVPPQGQRHTSR
jgi:universal stress protein A